jgi:hypothetical protein
VTAMATDTTMASVAAMASVTTMAQFMLNNNKLEN